MTALTLKALSVRIDGQDAKLDAILAALSPSAPASVLAPVTAPVVAGIDYSEALDNVSLARVLRGLGITSWTREEWIGHKVAAGLRAPEGAKKAPKKAPTRKTTRKGRKALRKAAATRVRYPKGHALAGAFVKKA